jgi:hypothetical protein
MWCAVYWGATVSKADNSCYACCSSCIGCSCSCTRLVALLLGDCCMWCAWDSQPGAAWRGTCVLYQVQVLLWATHADTVLCVCWWVSCRTALENSPVRGPVLLLYSRSDELVSEVHIEQACSRFGSKCIRSIWSSVFQQRCSSKCNAKEHSTRTGHSTASSSMGLRGERQAGRWKQQSHAQ